MDSKISGHVWTRPKRVGGGGAFVPASFFHGGKLGVCNCSVVYCSTIA